MKSNCFLLSLRFHLTGYTDADWAGDLNNGKSTSGYIFEFSWRSKKQTCVASSTAEAEYMALQMANGIANASQEVICSVSKTGA